MYVVHPKLGFMSTKQSQSGDIYFIKKVTNQQDIIAILSFKILTWTLSFYSFLWSRHH